MGSEIYFPGTVVGLTWRGMEVLRSLPESSKDAPSDRQTDPCFGKQYGKHQMGKLCSFSVL
ncbi:hypothetical protein [Pedobacter nyackensis]|uniref:hypothetical protein n=1 Tax=Pedobacter nyackensis TaxID=475255 RepID=UPI002930090D|nr:hypothetical protein [Pedobacter nyackensis]